ncbi:MAG: hypothetical protein LUI10_10840 [Lachnospiraceae bacterium]|nr:hypothetical protein [Lachnospiraceae bacterium]
MNRKLYWAVLLNPVFLILYGFGLSALCSLCEYGGVRQRLPLIAAAFACGLFWFLSWTIIYFIRKKKPGKGVIGVKWPKWVLLVELLVLLGLTGYYGYRIYQSAQHYNGRLGTYLYNRKTTRSIALDDTDLDFLANGLNGILDSLEEECGLDRDWELYAADTLVLEMDEYGTILSLEVLLYAFDEEGDYHGWLIDYDGSKSDEMTVYLGSRANTDYMEQEQLSPMFEMIDFLISDGNTSMLESFGFQTPASDEETDGGNLSDVSTEEGIVFTLRYSGYGTGNSPKSASDPSYVWYYLSKEDIESANQTDGDIDGFLLSLYRNDTKVLTMVTGVGTLDTVEEIKAREEEEERLAEIEAAKQKGKTLIGGQEGMTFYLDENTSMSLTVIDAAAGSRWYSFENGSIYNEDPFNGRWGVAESIYFLDEKTGFILISFASQDSSYIYYTSDGGETFEEELLPVGDGEEDMKGNAFDFTPEDMDYVYTPYEEDGILYVKVSGDSVSEVYMYLLFSSEDAGASWQYVSFQDAYGESYE